ncbi:hypothetical protein FIBSPDRAFT_966700 [Athelia psychrophila]|uniref:FAD-binding domain-containing protein n=1 Tax=Athelia psychrophila TaxID=1759441 RepID=A0A167WIQ7_9AGAM|nr:hypothetical protein FIBSPDRAFT_966700 [Fibularhizoctonia sp. CBS 109695]
MSSSPPKVLVVGAGPSGLISALTLLQNGIPVRIIAKEEKHRVGQRGSGISPRTMEIYKFLGVEEVLQKAVYLFDFLVRARGSSEVLKVMRMNPWLEPTPSTPWRTFLTMGQNNAEGILRSHLAKYGCEIELGTSLSSFQQNEDHVTATLIKSVDGKEHTEQIEIDWLIGADGARGVTRKTLGLTFLGESRQDENVVIGDMQIKGLSTANWHNWGDRQTKSLIFKPSEDPESDAFQFLIFGPEVDHVKLSTDPIALLDFLVEQSGMPKDAFGQVGWVTDYRPQFRMVDKFGEGRVFVVGDAAHVHSPAGGQGMNSSIQDALNLAWKLSLVAKSLSPPSLLSTYTSERLPVIAEMLNLSSSLQNLNKDLRAEDQKVFERGGKLMQLGVNYRGSTIVVDESEDVAGASKGDSYSGDGLLRGGDRAPDTPELVHLRMPGMVAEGTTRLFDIFKPYLHTVIIFSSGAAIQQCTAVLEALQTYPKNCLQSVVIHTWEVYRPEETGVELANMVVKDRIGHAYQGYAVAPLSDTLVVYIVRPDGVIGGLVHGVEGVQKYFSGIFL